jgi:hypothetical protein
MLYCFYMNSSHIKGSGWKWWLLYAFTGLIDGIQLLIGWTGIGTVISEAFELVMPFILIGSLFFMKVSLFRHPKRLISIIGITGLDAITAGIAPFWVLDVWYIQRDVKKEDAEILVQQQSVQLSSQTPLYKDGKRQVTPPLLPEAGRNSNFKPLIVDGIRAPQK